MPAIPPMPARDNGSIPPLSTHLSAQLAANAQAPRQIPRATVQLFESTTSTASRRLLIVDENWW